MYTVVKSPLYSLQTSNASINVKPVGGPRAYVGHLTSIAFPTLGNLTTNLGPVGTFAFLRGGIGPSHVIPCAPSVCSAAIKALKDDSL